MKAQTISFPCAVTLVGGGALDAQMLAEATRLAPVLVAADGAADRLRALGMDPALIVGDMDSLQDRASWDPEKVLALEEQDSTDFEKCLYSTSAPGYVAAGFTGRRVDHMLAAFHALLRYPDKRVVLLGEEEVIASLPAARTFDISVDPGAVVSIYPLLPVKGTHSRGLKWSVEGLEMAPGRQIGTSNEAVEDNISIGFDGPGAILMLERRYLGALFEALA